MEAMDVECKRFARHIRNLDKEVRAWDAFTGLESTVLNTLTSLRAVAELQNPAIRWRHWGQLMQATGVSFTWARARHWHSSCSSSCTTLRMKSGALWTKQRRRWGWRRP